MCVLLSSHHEDQSLANRRTQPQPQEEDQNRHNDHRIDDAFNTRTSHGLLFALGADLVRPMHRLTISDTPRPAIILRMSCTNPLATVVAAPGRRAGASRHTAAARARDPALLTILRGLDGIHGGVRGRDGGVRLGGGILRGLNGVHVCSRRISLVMIS